MNPLPHCGQPIHNENRKYHIWKRMNQIAMAPYLSRLNKMKLITETKSRSGLRLFPAKHYFQTCLIHYKFRRKWLNRYCMKCNKSVCQYCLPLGHHKTHKVLKIYSHLNSDVVRLSAMEKYMECYLIQPYKSNNELAIAMNPLPHCGQPIHNENRKCCSCKRISIKPNRYCSISCKVETFMMKTKMLVLFSWTPGSTESEKQENTCCCFRKISHANAHEGRESLIELPCSKPSMSVLC